jgi:hypothetical protein
MIKLNLGAASVVCFLLVLCNVEHPPEKKMVKSNNLEFRMAGGSGVQQSSRLFLSSEFKKISSQTAVLTIVIFIRWVF